MSQSLIQDFEYIAAHIKDYIDDDKLFTTFEIEDIEKIMKFANLTTNDFITLLKQSQSVIKSNKLYIGIRNANVSIQNYEEVVNLLKYSKKYLKLTFLDGVIDFLIQMAKTQSDYAKKIKSLQAELKTIQNQKQKSEKEIEPLKQQRISGMRKFLEQMRSLNDEENILSKISELKSSNDFESIYNFFEELSSQGNQKMISKACEEGLWLKEVLKSKNSNKEKNILHAACEKGNLSLVKSLIESGCDKGSLPYYKNTSLIYASENGQLEVVEYLISAGAYAEAKNNYFSTPLIKASSNGHLEVVKYLISVGVNKEARDIGGETALIKASKNGKFEVVKYLISVGANKNANNNNGETALILAKENVRD